MENNPTQGSFEDFINQREPGLRSICVALRDLNTICHPNFVEIVCKHQGIYKAFKCVLARAALQEALS